MKRVMGTLGLVVIGVLATVLVVLTVDPGGSSNTSPDLEPAIQECTKGAIANAGFTPTFAAENCRCFVEGLADIYTVERINAFYEGTAPIEDVPVLIGVLDECLDSR